MQSKRSLHASVRRRSQLPRKPLVKMEVHPPEHPIHTWREFCIHMGAIILGLLIAIGLEQSVEAIHNHLLRAQLEEDVRTEARRNVEILSDHLTHNIPNLIWYRSAAVVARSAVERNGYVDIALPDAQPGASSNGLLAPERYVIPIARTSGAIALLPRSVAEVYARLDFHAEEDEKEVDLIRSYSNATAQFELATGIRIGPGQHLHITLAQRDQLVNVTAGYATGLYALLRRDNIFLNASQAVANGIDDVAGLESFLRDYRLQVRPYQP